MLSEKGKRQAARQPQMLLRLEASCEPMSSHTGVTCPHNFVNALRAYLFLAFVDLVYVVTIVVDESANLLERTVTCATRQSRYRRG